MTTTTPRGRFLALLMTLVFIVTACTGGAGDADDPATDDGGDPATGDGQTEDNGTEDDAGDSGGGDTLTVATPGVVSSVDTERYEGFISIDLLPNIAGTLLRFETPEAGIEELQTPDALVGELAESWEENEDGTEVTFTLRDAMSSAGNPVTSEDVRWSIERMQNSEGVPIANILMTIGGWDLDNPIEVIDDRTFTINIAEPNAVSLSILTTFFMQIYDSVDAEANATDDDPFAYEYLSENTPTFGPYTLESFNPGTEVRLVNNPNYWRGEPEIKNVVIRAVPEGSNRLQLIEAGEVDIGMSFSFDQLASLRDSDGVRLERVLYPNIDVFVPNVEVEPFDDPLVRKAVAYAIDREAILESAYQEFGTVATDFFHDDFGYSPLSGEQLEYDPDRARDLLAEAGFEDGLSFEMAYNVANLGAHIEQVAVLLQSQLGEVGIDVQLRDMPSGADFDAAKRDGSLASWLATSLPLVPDPGYYLGVFYVTGGLTNLQNYSNEQVDQLARQITETAPGEGRGEVVQQVNDVLMEDMPTAPIVDTQKFYLFDPTLTGFRSYPEGHIEYYDLSFE